MCLGTAVLLFLLLEKVWIKFCTKTSIIINKNHLESPKSNFGESQTELDGLIDSIDLYHEIDYA